MSCPAELLLSVYVDGELELAERRPLESHLVACESCRARVLALREELELLGDALQERERATARLPSRAAPARGLALGALPSVAAVVLIATVLGWIVDARLVPAWISWLNPIDPQGVFDMAFDLVFLIRDEAPGLLALAVAGGATLGVSAILSFALTAFVRRFAGPGALLVALALLTAPAPSQAHFGLHRHRDFDLAAGETHDGSLVLSGARVTIEGVVDGDLIVMAERLDLRGEVQGNVVALARSADISGRVSGSVLCLCRDGRIAGSLDSDLYAFAESVDLADSAQVERNVTVAAEHVQIEGSVGRDLWLLGADRAELRGQVARHVQALHAQLHLRHEARVGGDVTAQLHAAEDLKLDPGATVEGETRTELVPRHAPRIWQRYSEPGFYLFHLISLAAAFLVGMGIHRFFPALLGARLESGGEFFRTLGLGFLALIVGPVALALCALTLVGIPLALFGFAVYLGSLYLSGILVAALVGTALTGPRPGATGFGLALLLGLLVVGVVAHLPFVGAPVHLLVALTGLGLLVRLGRDGLSGRRAAA